MFKLNKESVYLLQDMWTSERICGRQEGYVDVRKELLEAYDDCMMARPVVVTEAETNKYVT